MRERAVVLDLAVLREVLEGEGPAGAAEEGAGDAEDGGEGEGDVVDFADGVDELGGGEVAAVVC